jgi:hypothetical protein
MQTFITVPFNDIARMTVERAARMSGMTVEDWLIAVATQAAIADCNPKTVNGKSLFQQNRIKAS